MICVELCRGVFLYCSISTLKSSYVGTYIAKSILMKVPLIYNQTDKETFFQNDSYKSYI